MSQLLAPFQLLELNVISAQDLAPVGRNMRTYAVAWVHPDRKLSTRVDTHGRNNPTWNDKFVFRVDEEFLYADTSAIMIEIYALHWFRDIHVGTIRVLVGNLIPPPSRPFHNNHAPLGMRFVALQVRRASGRPQGILNIGVTVLDSSMRSMPLYTLNSSAVGYRHLMGEKDAYEQHNHMSPHVFSSSTAATKPELRRTKSDTSSMIGSEAVARQQLERVKAHKGKASSVITVSDASAKINNKSKKKGKGRSRASSMLSGHSVGKGKSDGEKESSILSDSGFQWQLTHHNVKASSQLSASEAVPEALNVEDNVAVNVNNNTAYSSINDSEPDASTSELNMKQGFVHQQVVAYEGNHNVSPKRQFRNSPAPQFKSSPAPQFHGSPAPPQFQNSPAPPQFHNSSVSQFKNSPAPPQFHHSPAPQFKNSPAPPQFHNSPALHFRNSPKPQFVNSPAPQQQFRNSPTPQFHNSPAVSKFNPVIGFGGSHKGTPKATPLHPFGKLNGAYEYGTPRRSNLANMGPPVITESELGPSPSEVAAAMARKPVVEEGENSTVGGWSLDESVEGLQSKLERWRTELPPVYDRGEFSSFPTSSNKTSQHARRHTDGGNGLFSCFSNICGIECSIVCGGDPKSKKSRRRHSPSVDNTSLL